MSIFQKAISANAYAKQGTILVRLGPNSTSTHTVSQSSIQNPNKIENVFNGRADSVTYWTTTGPSGS